MILIEAFSVMKDCRSIIYSPHGACNHDSESLLRGHLFLLLNTLAGRHDAESCLQVHVRGKLEKIGLCTPNGDRSLAWSTNKTDGHWWCAIIIINVKFALFSHRIIDSLTIQLSICFLMANFCWSPGSNSERFRNRRAFVFVYTKPATIEVSNSLYEVKRRAELKALLTNGFVRSQCRWPCHD